MSRVRLDHRLDFGQQLWGNIQRQLGRRLADFQRLVKRLPHGYGPAPGCFRKHEPEAIDVAGRPDLSAEEPKLLG